MDRISDSGSDDRRSIRLGGTKMNYSLKLRHFNDPEVELAWRKMESGSLSPYLYFDYMKFISDYTSFHTLYHPAVACVSDTDGRIVMLVPLKASLTRSYFKMLGDIQGCDRTDALYLPELGEEERAEATRCFYASMRKRLKIYRIQDGSPMLGEMPAERISMRNTNPYVRIAVPQDCDAALKALSSSVRQNLRTAYNRMRRDGKEFTLEIYEGGKPMPDEVWKEIMDLYFERLFSKYKGEKIKNFLSKIRWKTIYCRTKHDTRSLRSLPNARHILLRDGKRLVAFMSGLLTHDSSSFTVPRLAIDADYRFYSPGYILIDKTLREFSAEKITAELDMSRGDEKYKFDMGGTPYSTTDTILVHSAR